MGNQLSFAFLALGSATLLLLTTACVAGRPVQPALSRRLVFLTRDGCVNSATMRTRLDEALDRLGARKDYTVIDSDTLAESDVRRGYGTPTVLNDSRDLFGMPEPTPPVPSPT